uniref:CBF n=1 Tax=Litchi chinensis TaxID=151069 RepID=A0A8A2HDS2_LITCN|nr:CBF [Litchi chinensis]
MVMFSHLSDPLPLKSDKPELSTLSDAGTARRASHSDEEVLLATSRPKKRAGRRVFKETRHPIYRGVRRRNTDKWVCELREPNKKTRIWLGTYPTPEMAARAHDVAALVFKGKSACLNFADSAWRLPIPASKDAKDIRKTAKEAAEAFRPQEPIQVVSDEENVSKASPDQASCGGHEVANKLVPENGTFMDDEAVFDMPRLLANMAEGLLLSPPPLVMGDDDHTNWADEASDVGLSLWSFSF